MKPLGIDLFCGLGGFSEGMLSEGYDCVGFDIERHDYGAGGYPAQLVLQDVLTLHGKQFRDAALIVASPPCQEYSYMAMPWSRAKAIAAEYRSGVRDVKKLTALFDACFRIQREAIDAAGHFIPLVVENVRGAIPWVGRSRWNYGSFHLFGDVPALMPMTKLARVGGHPGLEWSKYGEPGYVGRGFNEIARERARESGFKTQGMNWSDQSKRGQDFTRIAGKQSAESDGVKHHASGAAWFDGKPDKMLGHFGPAKYGSHSNARKAASAAIARIPLPLATWIAKCYKPESACAAT